MDTWRTMHETMSTCQKDVYLRRIGMTEGNYGVSSLPPLSPVTYANYPMVHMCVIVWVNVLKQASQTTSFEIGFFSTEYRSNLGCKKRKNMSKGEFVESKKRSEI